ncbi:conserved hypothetical protein [uncultured Alphaproteobacteria bacterium]|uniref:DUF2336 domain-containing protein n=1 Tax=uncultured Alphaproteobacteria bacterium TaxID=91750 RepID=A0A212JBN9_9PROT|nr:conserved hypothetical protein [uncultured Alphaproteobacteria bacterium]
MHTENAPAGGAAPVPPPRDYEDAKRMARHPDAGHRMAVASSHAVAPEILYYMVDDPHPAVRCCVAANPATPTQADGKLANDEDASVRAALARKIAERAPGLTPKDSHVHAVQTLALLEKLARDQLPTVRRVVAEVLKNEARIPAHIVQALARDIELAVAAPVLEFSPLLADDDLVDILSTQPVPGAMTAVSKRRGLGGQIADLVARSDDIEAMVALLNNPTAQMREETLDVLIARAPDLPPLHEPLVRRPGLPARAAIRLATFVADGLLDHLAGREDFDAGTLGVLRAAVRDRIERSFEDRDDEIARETFEQEVASARALHEKKPITEDLVRRSLEYEHDLFVKACLVVRSGCAPATVRRILAARHPEAVLALCWKAGFGADVAALVQTRLGGIEAPLSADVAELSPPEMDRLLADYAPEG